MRKNKKDTKEYAKKYYEQNKEKMKAYDKARKARIKAEKEDDDKGEYKMTEEERKQFNVRWRLVFSPTQRAEYIYNARDMYDGYTSR